MLTQGMPYLKVHCPRLQRVVVRVLADHDGRAAEQDGQPAHFLGGVLAEPFDVRQHLEQEERLAPPGAHVEAPGTDVAFLGEDELRPLEQRDDPVQ